MTQPNADFQRIRGYLQQQAAQRDIEDLIGRVQEGIDELAAAARAVPAAKLDVIPQGDEWTPLACLQHAAAWNMRVAQQVLFVALEGTLPPDEEPTLPADRDEVLQRQSDAIDSLYEHVRAADPSANLDVKWEHQFFGDLNWREWLLFLRIHAKDHAGQLTAMSAASD